jgi:hypothetical protein
MACVIVTLLRAAIIFLIDQDDLLVVAPVIKTLCTCLQFISILDSRTHQYFTDKLELVEMLLLCDAQSEVMNCLVDLQWRFRRFVLYNGLITNRLKKVNIEDDKIGTFALLPRDARLIILSYV